MVDYVVTKENQGVYHNNKQVHLPDTMDLVDRNARWSKILIITMIISYSCSPDSGSTDLNDFLIKGYAKQIKERNSMTGS